MKKPKDKEFRILRRMKTYMIPFVLIVCLSGCSYFTYNCLNFTDNDSGNHYCEIHNQKLDKKLVWIHYGLMGEKLWFPEEWRRKKLADSLFEISAKDSSKYAWLSYCYRGGCFVGSQKFAKIFYCKKCNEQLAEWMEVNKSNMPYEGYLPIHKSNVVQCLQCTENKRYLRHHKDTEFAKHIDTSKCK